MKLAATIARVLLGLVFTIFGLNGFLDFIPHQPVPPLAGQFAGALIQSNYMMVVFAIQLACGILFLSNRFVPLALTLIAPVIVNILLFHIFLAPAGLGIAVFVTLLWITLAYSLRTVYAGLFQPSVEAKA